jgi:N-acetylglutamate synthase-like GNAT family acetyltransferase
MSRDISATKISGSDQAFVAALAGAYLPVDDLNDEGRRFFAFCSEDGIILGYGGAELHGNIALLRSVVISERFRGKGVGKQIVNWILGWLRSQGCTAVYMLTTTAAAFGASCGFEKLDRKNAPEPIRNSKQMMSLCPSSAVLMVQNLQENTMTKLEIYDPAMCCSTGVCGPEADPLLVAFAADLKWVADQGVAVQRYNLAHEPQAFAANPAVVKAMEGGMDQLPVIAIDGRIVSTGVYLSRDQLAAKLGLTVSGGAASSSCCSPKTGCCG